MINALRTRIRPDNLKNQVRAGGKSMARRLYLLSVAVLTTAVLLQVIGPFIFLDADGLITTERDVIAPDYVGRVVQVHVKPGDSVEAGQPLIVLESREVMDRFADLAARQATLRAREAQIVARVGTIEALQPLARQRRELAEKGEGQKEAVRERSIADNQRIADAAREAYEAERDRAGLAAEARGIDEKRDAVRSMHAAAMSRRERAKQQNAQINALAERGLTTSQRKTETSRELYEAERELLVVDAELAAIDRRNAVLESQLPAAIDRERRALASQADLKRLLAENVVPAQRRTDMARERYEAEREEAMLGAEYAALTKELSGVRTSMADLDEVLRSFKAMYNEGVIRSPSSGQIGARVPTTGYILKLGELAIEVLKGEPFVLAYLPTNRVFAIEEGDRVIVTDGAIKRRGVVERLEAMADAVPIEFQNVFSSRDRQQVVRVRLDEASGRGFALQSKVKVTGPFTPTNLTASIKSFLAGVSQGIMRLAGIETEDAGDTRFAIDAEAPLTTGSIGRRPAVPAGQ